MKANIIVASLLMLALFSSCKDEKKEEAKAAPVLNNIQVTLDLVIKKDDSLQLFYKDEAIPAFNEENSIITPVKGSSERQEIVFNLPEEITPTELRFDIGNKEGQLPVVINNFKMQYKDAIYNSKDSTMLYFLPNNQLKYDQATKTLTYNKVENEPYDPFIYSTELLKKQVGNLYKTKK